MDNTTRRQVLTGATLGAAATLAASGAADAQGSAPQGQAAGGKQDPRSKYPKPPFKSQQQPWPGLAGRMEPRPDHGETSYVGTGRLRGRKALITGGDSGMGRAAAIAYAREGADVAINYLPEEEPDAREVVDLIRQAGRKAVAIPGDLRSESFCRSLVDRTVSGLGGLDTLVMNAGRQQSIASIADVTTDEFDRTMKTNLYAPFWIIKAALTHLEPGSVIIGTTSEQAYDPSPDLYAYAQTKAATMNYVKSLARAAWVEGHPSQRRCARTNLDAAAYLGRSQRRQGGHLRCHRAAAAPVNPPNLPASMYVWPRTTAAIPPATFTAPAAVRVSRDAPVVSSHRGGVTGRGHTPRRAG